MDIIIVTNSPGEIAGWVMPVVKELNLEFKNIEHRIIVFIPHCEYASGSEKIIAGTIPGVDHVFGPREHLNFLFFNKSIKNGFSKKGILIHLGSDYMNSVLIARRLSYPTFVYAYDIGIFNQRFFKKIFVADNRSADKLTKKGIDPKKIEVAGNLVADSVNPVITRDELRARLGFSEKDFVVGIFPGSRPYQIKYMTPFFLKCAEILFSQFPNLKFILSKPAFISLEKLKDTVENFESSSVLEGVQARINDNIIKTKNGTEVKLLSEMPYEAINICDIIMTIPGTNTAQIAALSCPMVVAGPLNKMDEIPLDGIAGYIQYIPFFGRSLKRFLVKKFSDSIKWTALPNHRAEEEIVPEVRGILKPADISVVVAGLIEDPQKLRMISEKLKEITGIKGAGSKIAKTIYSFFVENLS